jgi:hypothetical protein
MGQGIQSYVAPPPLAVVEHNNGNSGATPTISFAGSLSQAVTLNNNAVITLTGIPIGATATLRIYTGTGGYSVTWAAGIVWPSASAPTITTTANDNDILTFYNDGTNIYGRFSGSQAYPGIPPAGFNAALYGSPKLWLDGNDSTSASMSLTGSTITTWKNKGSVSSSNFTAQATFSAATLASGVYLGNSAASFNGTTQVMQSASLLTNYLPSASAWTVAWLFNLNTYGVGNAYGLGGLLSDAGNAGFVMFNNNSYKDFTFGNSAIGFGSYRFTVPSPTGWNVVIIVYNGSGVGTVGNFIVRLNGVVVTPVSSGGYAASYANNIGDEGNGLFSGYIMEEIVYPSALTGSNLSGLETALRALAGI